ncbi:MAG: hypothetical protein A2539_08095 [Elusimicrobia bacterium RIFOXYD2_FULL_34_15]|nr:MAG: hypothetical protein A2539_08095 [Elusimicrobia bacterium RIFOXYD2_FULL_34_15]
MENKKYNIMVVDDDKNLLDLLEINLKKSGYNVVSALDGIEGLKKTKIFKPDLVIVDLKMPGMDGYHFCWNILYEDGLYISPVPKIIILTARDEKLDRGISKKIGVDAYITKPFEIEMVINKVKALLGENVMGIKKKIAVIDDDPNVAELICTNLLPDKYECVRALDGEDGSKLIDSEKPDLIVLDLLMPRKTGYELCSEIKTNPATAKIPVILLTKKKEHRDRYIGTVFLKADEYVPKPFDINDLIKKIEKILG